MDSILEKLDQKSKEELSDENLVQLRNKIIALRKEGVELSLLMTDKNRSE